uniref:Late embryogenesis abundant protein LEA-2 subgroup domain-containing protein n=1 Tax=Oryza glumipatula TaxID=40148 RepID=A0A0D9YE00_9ORYZ
MARTALYGSKEVDPLLVLRTKVMILFYGTVTIVLVLGIQKVKYTLDLAAVEGMDVAAAAATAGAGGSTVISPAFNLTLRVENPRTFWPWCLDRGDVVVSYSGVALAWGRVPGFCVQKRSMAKLTVVPWGKNVHLSQELRERFVSELQEGTAKVYIEMKLHYYANFCMTAFSPSTGMVGISQELTLGGRDE